MDGDSVSTLHGMPVVQLSAADRLFVIFFTMTDPKGLRSA
ncbi:Unknown protein sequence [Pseudomonas syringae pv. syringae]|nr:Unknown protein sequence [Pseudomonas syringae pv. syringae]